MDAVPDYPNDGETYQDSSYYPGEPDERIEDESHQAAILAASEPIMADVAAWFNEQIEACDSRRNITAYAISHGKEVNQVADAFDIVRELLEAKSRDFLHLKDKT